MEELFEKINEIIKKYDSFIVMGHKDPDLDSLGSSLGFCEIIESFGKKAYLFLDDNHLEDYNKNINQAFDKMEKDIMCVKEKTYKKIKGNTLLIVTDVHTQSRLEYSKLPDIMDTMVLDHHIKNKDYIKNAKFFYIDSNLSSMSELVTYYARYVNIEFDTVISTILLGGIEIDTNGFNLKTTGKTYEAASILMDMGADSILKQELLKETKEQYIKRANFIKSSFMINDKVAMCIIDRLCTSMELAEVVEELLTFEDVRASFVIGKLDTLTIGVSARSIGEIDVSIIMKKMNGGGSNSTAASQVKDKTIKEVKQQIINIINEEI